jgi:hypothetical protein
MAKQFDAIEDAILQAYQKNKNSRRRVQIRTDKFKEITLVEVIIGNVKDPDDVTKRVRIFYQGDEMVGAKETWGYNLTREQRCPIISKMMFEGYTQQRISEMLKIHVGTVHKDVRYMRDHTVMLDGYEFRSPFKQAKVTVKRLSRTKPVDQQLTVH